MKRFFSAVLPALLVVMAAGCGGDEPVTKNKLSDAEKAQYESGQKARMEQNMKSQMEQQKQGQYQSTTSGK